MTGLKRRPHGIILVITCLLTFFCALGAAKNDGNGPPSSKEQNIQKTSKPLDPAAEGERRFEINCGRCHRPPDGISPRISKTILQHMRVKAMLTQEDEYYILKYIAP
jgi:mono/diheme cytochrome c family protein